MIPNRVKCALAAALVTFACSSTAFAQQGNAEAGKAKTMVCNACHGPTGNESVLDNVPKLGGQGQRYLLKQMTQIKSGERAIPLMAGILNNLSEQDLADIAAYFSSLKKPEGAVEPEKRELGEQIYRAGNASIGVAACSACHAPNGMGNPDAGFPSLSGQDVAYTELQLKSFRDGTRMNDTNEIMRTITARLNDKEIAALASFVAGLR